MSMNACWSRWFRWSQACRLFAVLVSSTMLVVALGGCTSSALSQGGGSTKGAEAKSDTVKNESTEFSSVYDFDFQNIARYIDSYEDNIAAETGRKDYLNLRGQKACSIYFDPSGKMLQFEFSVTSKTLVDYSPVFVAYEVGSDSHSKTLLYDMFYADDVAIADVGVWSDNGPVWEGPGDPDLDAAPYIALSDFSKWYKKLDLKAIAQDYNTEAPVLYELTSDVLRYDELEILGDNAIFLDCTDSLARQMSADEVTAMIYERITSPDQQKHHQLDMVNFQCVMLLAYYPSDGRAGIREQYVPNSSVEQSYFAAGRAIVLCIPIA